MRTRTALIALTCAALAAPVAAQQNQPGPNPPRPPRDNRPVVINPPTVRTALPVLGVEYSVNEPQWAPIYNGVYYGPYPLLGVGGYWPGWWYARASTGAFCGPGFYVTGLTPYAATFGLDWVRIDPAIGFQSLSQYWPGHIWGPPLAEIDRRLDPATSDFPATPVQPPPPPPPPPSLQSLALEALRSGDFERAAPMLERVAQNQADAEKAALTSPPPDRAALRLHAVALAALGRFDDAGEALRRADIEDSSLRTRPIDAPAILGGNAALRRIVNSAVVNANRQNTPEAWRLVGHLMAAEGRLGDAQRMFERADQLAAQAAPAPASQGVVR